MSDQPPSRARGFQIAQFSSRQPFLEKYRQDVPTLTPQLEMRSARFFVPLEFGPEQLIAQCEWRGLSLPYAFRGLCTSGRHVLGPLIDGCVRAWPFHMRLTFHHDQETG